MSIPTGGSGPLAVMLEAGVDERYEQQVPLALLEQVVERALAAEGLGGTVEVSLVVTDDAMLRRLNATYRGVDQATDVLSFPLLAPEDLTGQDFVGPPDGVLRLGDVVLSFPRAEEQAASYGHSLERELAYLTVHGVLHLLGYDHEDATERRVMRAKEESALAGEADNKRARGSA